MGDWVGGQGLLLDRSLAQLVDPQGQFHLGWVSKIGGPIVFFNGSCYKKLGVDKNWLNIQFFGFMPKPK